MKYLVEFTAQNGQKRYRDFEGDDIDVAVSIVSELGANESYKKAAHIHGSGSVREGDKIMLRTKGKMTEYQTLAEAHAAAALLPLDEGYDIISLEQPVGSRNTIVVEHRPSLKDNA